MFNLWPHSVGWRSGIAVICGVGRRGGLDLALLWLWCKPADTQPLLENFHMPLMLP